MVPRLFTRVPSRIVERIAQLSPPCHRDLVQGMVAELDSIADPAERTRFALGAITAIARLALRWMWRPSHNFSRNGGSLRFLLKRGRRYDKSYFAMVGLALLPALGLTLLIQIVGRILGGSESVLELVSNIVLPSTFFAACYYIRARQTPRTT
jgi:hypothetical protein